MIYTYRHKVLVIVCMFLGLDKKVILAVQSIWVVISIMKIFTQEPNINVCFVDVGHLGYNALWTCEQIRFRET